LRSTQFMVSTGDVVPGQLSKSATTKFALFISLWNKSNSYNLYSMSITCSIMYLVERLLMHPVLYLLVNSLRSWPIAYSITIKNKPSQYYILSVIFIIEGLDFATVLMASMRVAYWYTSW